MALLRDGTLDHSIWTSVHTEYPTLPRSFAPGEILLDVGCHTGAVCALAAHRGATVVGYEANRENFALAQINLARHPSVTLHRAAIWRSDVTGPPQLLFTPCADTANTGSGSVLFASVQDHWAVVPQEIYDPGPPEMVLTTHAVDAVGLDEVLEEIGAVRFLKIDVEGAEFPILLTARRLDLVTSIGGEYHQFTADEMTALAPSARVGEEPYSADLLQKHLEAAGFEVTLTPDRFGRGHFSAQRSIRTADCL